MDKARIDGEADNLVTFINNEYAEEKNPIDKDWIEMVIDKFYHPEKYEVESKKTNLDLLPMFDYYMEMHPISEVRKKNYRVVRRILARYELYIRIAHKGPLLSSRLMESLLIRFRTCGSISGMSITM
jgi:hypothetical protein